ncbi:MAG TPA: MBL fold metallo-hydrolase, partial [Chitinophagaceae bacterium]|nr:MBL fold metallo-hydrolase [Chitinophagaceae bacterium]
MKKMISASCFAIVFTLFALPALSQGFDSVEIKTVKITHKIYMLEGAGGNIGVLTGNDGIVLIDDQFAPLSEKIKAALKAISDKPVKFLINTHFHGDHVGGNENFGNEGAVIVAHDNVRMRLTREEFLAAFNMKTEPSPYNALPKITFTDTITLHVNGETLQVIHIKNAHTDGDAIIYFKESNVIHTGDVFVRYGLPFIDQEHGGNINGMINGVNTIIAMSNDNTKIIPGHGDVATKKDAADFNAMLEKIRNKIADAIKKGKTLKQITDENQFTEYPAAFDR